MKKNKSKYICLFFILLTITACEVVNPIKDEQYKKEVYIIGAYNQVSTFELPFGNDEEAFISLSASGTKKVEQDVNITLKNDDEIIDWYNAKYMLDAPVKYQPLNSELINIPSWTATLRSGEIYTHLPFTVNTSKLHCDSLYAITFAIESVSHYQKAESGTELILTLKLTNDFSGTYHMEATKIELQQIEKPNGDIDWIEQGIGIPVNIQRNLTATSSNEIRFFHEKKKETLAEYSNSWDPGKDYFDTIKNYCIKLVKTDETDEIDKFTIEPWDEINIIAGEAEYDKSEETFTFWYDYIDDSKHFRMKGIFRK